MDTLITSVIRDTVIVAEKEYWNFDGSTIVALFAILISGFVSFLTLRHNNRNVEMQIRGNTEIKFRQEWLDNVRITFSEFNSYIKAIIFYNNIYGKTSIEQQSDKLRIFSEYSEKYRARYFKLKLLFNTESDAHRFVNEKLDEIYKKMNDLYFFNASEMESLQLNLTNLIQKILVKEWYEIIKKQSKVKDVDNEIKEMIKTTND